MKKLEEIPEVQVLISEIINESRENEKLENAIRCLLREMPDKSLFKKNFIRALPLTTFQERLRKDIVYKVIDDCYQDVMVKEPKDKNHDYIKELIDDFKYILTFATIKTKKPEEDDLCTMLNAFNKKLTKKLKDTL
jgi:hypothetical protein